MSGSVLVPDTAPPATGRNVVAWAHGTTGSGDRCAPSTDVHPANGIEDARPLLAAGDAIVATDYQGLGTPGPHPYLIGASEARSVLDAVRAARHLPRTGLGTGLVVFGHSQGGQATLFTAELAAGYAPELNLLGAAAAAPPTDLTALAMGVTGLDYGVAYLVEIAAGYSATDPAARLSTIVTTRAATKLHLVEDGCTDDLISTYDHLNTSAVFTHDPRTTPPWSTGLAANSVTTVPRSVPVLIMQGARDPIVSADVTARAVTAMCGAGDTVSYSVYPKAAHNVVPSAANDLNAWIAARFRHRAAPRTCPAPTVTRPRPPG
ncbi:lipase family protein [Actinomadura nitritigenes]|uniref:lipase family protein n=1 Tax=Actinomadura nitritigenes TaxID=134602 RepID=UPI003D8E415B